MLQKNSWKILKAWIFPCLSPVHPFLLMNPGESLQEELSKACRPSLGGVDPDVEARCRVDRLHQVCGSFIKGAPQQVKAVLSLTDLYWFLKILLRYVASAEAEQLNSLQYLTMQSRNKDKFLGSKFRGSIVQRRLRLIYKPGRLAQMIPGISLMFEIPLWASPNTSQHHKQTYHFRGRFLQPHGTGSLSDDWKPHFFTFLFGQWLGWSTLLIKGHLQSWIALVVSDLNRLPLFLEWRTL